MRRDLSNNKVNILIIEDEAWAAKHLQNMVLRIEPAANILDTISSVLASVKWLESHPAPDLILSDIQLSDGISFEIFETLHIQCPIIFVTAFDEYAIRAFKLHSIDYLLKPVDEHELAAAINKYRSLNIGSQLQDQLKFLVGSWGNASKKYKERFLTLHRNALVPVMQDEIAFFHKEELIYLHTLMNEKYISEHHTLDEIEVLVNPEVFFRASRQYIIHIKSVDRVKTTAKGLTVQLKPIYQTEIDISREKATAFKKWLG
jgi:two-component system LytT family response regulator